MLLVVLLVAEPALVLVPEAVELLVVATPVATPAATPVVMLAVTPVVALGPVPAAACERPQNSRRILLRPCRETAGLLGLEWAERPLRLRGRPTGERREKDRGSPSILGDTSWSDS